MQDLRIGLIQTDTIWRDISANLTKVDELIANSTAHIFVMPEMFTTGFAMKPEGLSEQMNGATVNWFRKLAAQKNAALAGSIVIEEDGRYYNRLLFAEPSGTIHHYDKKHLFALAGEGANYAAGNAPHLLEYKGWKIHLQICYDLRFPAWARKSGDFDLFINVANWPKPRIEAWSALLRARAIENQSYAIGVNRVGHDPNNNVYPGRSTAFSFLGDKLLEMNEHEGVAFVELNKSPLQSFKEKHPFWKDRDHFNFIDPC